MATVLLVDDPTVVSTFAAYLDPDGYEVLGACCREQTLDIIDDRMNSDIPVDVVVLDVDMLDGYELVRILKDEQTGWPEMQVVACGTGTTEHDIRKAKDLCGADYFIGLPLSAEGLRFTVAAAAKAANAIGGVTLC